MENPRPSKLNQMGRLSRVERVESCKSLATERNKRKLLRRGGAEDQTDNPAG